MSIKSDTKPSNPKDIVGSTKVAMSYVPANVEAEIAVGMMEGAFKYGRHNYRVVGVRASIYYDAARRHLMAWWEGEDVDKASSLSHISKAISSLVVLRDAMIRDNWDDDRPPKSKLGWLDELNRVASEVIARFPEPKKAYTERYAARVAELDEVCAQVDARSISGGGWRSKETAPRDGRVFIGRMDLCGGVRICTVHFETPNESDRYGGFGPFIWRQELGDALAEDVLLAWAPLPEGLF